MSEIYRLKRWDETAGESGKYVDFLPFYPDNDNEAQNIKDSQGLIPSVKRVLTNTNSITDLNTTVDTNTSNIAALNTKVETNTSNIAALNTTVDTNTSNISTNTNNITALTTKVNTNTSNISTNTNNIAALTTKVDTNTSDITDLETKVDTNTSNISTNTNNIAALTTKVDTNTSDITDLETKVENISANTSDITTLKTKVNTNTSNISANTNNIAALTTKVDENTSNIAQDISSVTVSDLVDGSGVLTLTSNENSNNITITSMGVAKDPSNKTCTITPYTSKIKVIGCSESTLGLTQPDGDTLNITTPGSSIMCIDPNICTPTTNYLYLGGSSNDTTNKWDRLYLHTKTNKLLIQEQSIETTYPVQMHAARYHLHEGLGSGSSHTKGVPITYTNTNQPAQDRGGACLPLQLFSATSSFMGANDGNSKLFDRFYYWGDGSDSNSTGYDLTENALVVKYNASLLISGTIYANQLEEGSSIGGQIVYSTDGGETFSIIGGRVETRLPAAVTTGHIVIPPVIVKVVKGSRIGLRCYTYTKSGYVPTHSADGTTNITGRTHLDIVCLGLTA